MDLRSELDYDAKPDAVFEMLCDEEFRRAVCRATGAKTYAATVTRSAESASVRIQRVMPAEVPDFVKKFVGESIEVVQTEEWAEPADDGSRTANLRVQIPGKPAAMDGEIVLTPSGGGSHELISGDVKVSIPLVGKKIETEIARGIRAAINAEGRVGAKWLAGER